MHNCEETPHVMKQHNQSVTILDQKFLRELEDEDEEGFMRRGTTFDTGIHAPSFLDENENMLQALISLT